MEKIIDNKINNIVKNMQMNEKIQLLAYLEAIYLLRKDCDNKQA